MYALAQNQLTLVKEIAPAWATRWGMDEYGKWADLTVTKNETTVSQKMRWIKSSQQARLLVGSNQTERNQIKNKTWYVWANQTESTPFEAHVEKGFWLANSPCTQRFWKAIVGSNPSYFKNDAKDHLLPVESVSYLDDRNKEQSIQYFLQNLNETMNSRNIVACLPTEIEWEYACRANTETTFWWGNYYQKGFVNCNESCNKSLSDQEGTSPFDCYRPNPWGLYDMHGNVWEWTSSIWKEKLNVEGEKDQIGLRVLRGGSWFDPPELARSASRLRRYDDNRDQRDGFRFMLRH